MWVYLPPGYDDNPARRYPTVYQIQGLTGQLDMWRNRSPFRKNFPELVDELFAKGETPHDLSTGMLIPQVLERWLAWDPVRMVPSHAESLRTMRAIYIDAGKRDEFFLDLGAEAFRQALANIGITDVFFELFDATHMSIEYRYPLSLKYLAERLS